jgi:dienelactone hydrolase
MGVENRTSVTSELFMQMTDIEYKHGSDVLEGFLAFDETKGDRRPGILLFPEWYGVAEHAKARAKMLAELGYVAFAADMYGKGIRPTQFDDCAREAGKYQRDRQLMRGRGRAGLDVLRSLSQVNPNKLAGIGYCVGGTLVLELARDGADLSGIVTFHAALNTPRPEDAKNIKGKVLVLHGADDALVPDAEVLAFEKEMRDAKVDWQLVSYGNTVHSFTNWDLDSDHSKPAAYNEKSDARSWAAMRAFFEEIFA